jgi:hypothetical protein
MNRSEVMKKAWKIRRTGKSWSESLKKAWQDTELDHLFDDPFAVTESAPRKPFDPLKTPALWDTYGWAVYRAQMNKQAGIPA